MLYPLSHQGSPPDGISDCKSLLRMLVSFFHDGKKKTKQKNNLLLGTYLKKTIIQKDICTPVSIAALFTVTRACKHPKCPSTEEWMKKI